MALEIYWTEEANNGLDEVISYLEEEWTEQEIKNFFSRLEYCLEQIKLRPELPKDSWRKIGTKEYQHSPQTTIFYSYDASGIYILKLWLNHKNPNRL